MFDRDFGHLCRGRLSALRPIICTFQSRARVQLRFTLVLHIDSGDTHPDISALAQDPLSANTSHLNTQLSHFPQYISHVVAEQRGCSTASAVMAEYLQRVGEQPSELPVEEVNLLSAVFKNADDSRRAAWRVITSAEQKEKSKGKEQLASHAREYVAKVEGELQKIRDGILALMDKNLIRLACTDESRRGIEQRR